MLKKDVAYTEKGERERGREGERRNVSSGGRRKGANGDANGDWSGSGEVRGRVEMWVERKREREREGEGHREGEGEGGLTCALRRVDTNAVVRNDGRGLRRYAELLAYNMGFGESVCKGEEERRGERGNA